MFLEYSVKMVLNPFYPDKYRAVSALKNNISKIFCLSAIKPLQTGTFVYLVFSFIYWKHSALYELLLSTLHIKASKQADVLLFTIFTAFYSIQWAFIITQARLLVSIVRLQNDPQLPSPWLIELIFIFFLSKHHTSLLLAHGGESLVIWHAGRGARFV